MSYSDIVRRSWADWPPSLEWSICGTLNFSAKNKPSRIEALRHWSTYWNKIDRLCYGQSRNNQRRVPRFVFTHKGKNADNPHIHFLAHTPLDPREFSILLNAVWAGMHRITAIADQNEILPIFSKERISSYLLHEDEGYEIDGFNGALTHLPEFHNALNDSALPRLRAAADHDLHLQDAILAYPKHLVRAEERFRKRSAN